jgi:hypothetical protein
MPKMYKGNTQPTGEWRILEGSCHSDGAEWIILYKPYEKSFLNLKVAAKGKALAKANYWFSLKMSDKSMFGRDFSVMRESRPDLHDFVMAKIPEMIAVFND